MLKPLRRLQPSYYETFRCVGSECEDTCCKGWRVPVDKQTYEKYQTCSHPGISGRLQTLVTINPARTGDETYADIKLVEGACPFLTEGLCEVQSTIGESYLSNSCAIYPRILCSVDGVLERALDLSCPEAARLALTNPELMQFVERDGEDDNERTGTAGIVDRGNSKRPDQPYQHIHEVRSLMISLLQNRCYPLSQRLLVLGRLCDELETEGTDGGCGGLRDVTREYAPISPRVRMAATDRFETAIELILARIGTDVTTRRFLDCYQNFMAGLHWTMKSTMEELAERFDAGYEGQYACFRNQHGYMLENFLVAYVFRGLFPFGVETLNKKLAEYGFEHSVSHRYQMMVVDFVVIETLLTGLAVFHGERFGTPEAVRLIQSATKTFEHSLDYPGKALELLARKGLVDCASMGMLIRD